MKGKRIIGREQRCRARSHEITIACEWERERVVKTKMEGDM